jgi:hypothetical protein
MISFSGGVKVIVPIALGEQDNKREAVSKNKTVNNFIVKGFEVSNQLFDCQK